MNVAEHVINRLGGTRKAATVTKFPPSTIQSWKTAGVIPAHRQREVLLAARAHGISLSANEMVMGGEVDPDTTRHANDEAAQRGAAAVLGDSVAGSVSAVMAPGRAAA